jgi:iron complex transport system substrate-binding protein
MLNSKTSGGLRAPLSITRRAVLGSMAAGLLVRPSMAAGELRFPHAFGEAVLPGPAKRVVSLGYTTHDALLALEVPPVALRYWFGDQPNGVWPWAQPFLNGATPTMISGEAGAETIAALQPDLIIGIGSGISEAEYAVLSQIAPTLMQEKGRGAYDTSWDELTRTLGRAVGKDTLAEERIAATKKLFAEARARHPDWAGKRGVAAYHFGGDTALSPVRTRAAASSANSALRRCRRSKNSAPETSMPAFRPRTCRRSTPTSFSGCRPSTALRISSRWKCAG